jgi:trigger factor
VKLTVEVEPELFSEAKKRAARKLAQKYRIPGFRPGKAPYQIIVKQVGEGAVIEEAMELLVNDIYPKAIEEVGIEPYGPGELEKITSYDPPIFDFIVPLEAKVELGDYHTIRLHYEPKPIEETDVERVLEDLRGRQAVIEPVDRPAMEGDLVTARLSSKRKSEETGESVDLIKELSYPLIINSEKDAEAENEWPFPGFSRNLIGLSVGATGSTTHTFSADAEFESLRNVEAEYEYAVESIKSRSLPALDDEFVKTLGDFESVTDLRTRIFQDLETQSKRVYDEDYDNKVLENLVEISVIKYPPQMVEREIDNVIHNLEHRLENQSQDLELYLKARNMTLEELREEAKPVSETRLKKTLAMLEFAKAEKIQVDQDELRDETQKTISTLVETLPEKEAKLLNNRDVFSNLISNIMTDIVVRNATERLQQIARGIEPTSDEVIVNPEAGEEVKDPSSTPESMTGDTNAPVIEEQ